MTPFSPVPAAWWADASEMSWIVLATQLPFRQRLLVTAGLVGFAGVGLLVLAAKLRAAGDEVTTDRQVSRDLERTDLKDGGDPANTLESIIWTANRWETYALAIALFFGLAVLAAIAGLPRDLVGVGLFGGFLFSLEAFLKYCWPSIEAFYERRQPAPEDRDPDSIRFQGFSVDSMILMTLIVGLLGVFGALIALEVALT